MSQFAGRRAKIVATIGPSTSAPAMLRSLVAAGVDVFRLNFSHGELDGHRAVIEALRSLRDETGRNFAILQDLPGPKVRVGRLLDGGAVDLQLGARIELTSRGVSGTAERIPLSYPYLLEDVDPGQTVLLDDGRLQLLVTGKTRSGLVAVVERGGTLFQNKGANFPGVPLRWPAMTDTDERLLRFGLEHGVDLVALSFVRHPNDAEPVRRVMRAAGRNIPLIAKIEKPQALDHLEGILMRFDGVMVARGDLGVELATELVPVWQKRIIRRANDVGKPVITATQMLESMTTSPRPTRAEASDVANAVIDGSDAVMLSSETSIGAYPLEAVQTMGRIIMAAESTAGRRREHGPVASYDAHAVAHAACELAHELRAGAIAVVTRSGQTARLVSAERPETPIIAFTDNPAVYHALCLWWGIHAHMIPLVGAVESLAPEIEDALQEMELVRDGERFVLVGATPAAAGALTNFLKLHVVGETRRQEGAAAPDGGQ